MSLYHNHIPVGILWDNKALPNATSADGDMVFVGANTNGRLQVEIFADTDIAVDTAKAFNIELECFTSDTVGSATTPFSYNNSGTQTTQPNAHLYLVHKTSADGGLAWTAGDAIIQIPLPANTMDLMNYNWINLKVTTDEDLSAQKITAIVTTLK